MSERLMNLNRVVMGVGREVIALMMISVQAQIRVVEKMWKKSL